jgi:glutamine amidotransferase
MRKYGHVVIVDYGMGNLWSVASALKFLDAEYCITDDTKEIQNADALILPGVGSYRLAMQSLRQKDLITAIADSVYAKKRKILGICLGFQMLALSSTEDGDSEGLGFIPAKVERFSYEDLNGRKLPHIGFNKVQMPASGGFFSGFNSSADFYFVHSYRMLPDGLLGNKAICNYGVDFLAAYQNENIFGAQFHPEKSQTNGLALLKNFLVA